MEHTDDLVDSLRWRVPTGGDPRLLRLGLAQIGLATVIAAATVLLTVPNPWKGPAIAGLIPLAVLMAYRRRRRYHESLRGPDNVRLDAAGLHWIDSQGAEQTFRRADAVAFRVALEPDTLRPVPALTLHLAGGWETQPLELHLPATPDAVRQALAAGWSLPERDSAGASAPPAYDRALDVYSECHEEQRDWHWEGTRESLAEFLALLEQAARQLPPPPAGVKPAEWIVLAQRREPARLHIAHAPEPRWEHDRLAAPASVLATIAASGLEQLASSAAESPSPRDTSFAVPLGDGSTWTFHLHVREGAS